MRRFMIEVPDGPGPCDLIDEYGRRCNGLTWDELIGQVISVAHPNLCKPQYLMHTAEDWEELRRRLHELVHGDQDVVDPEVTF